MDLVALLELDHVVQGRKYSVLQPNLPRLQPSAEDVSDARDRLTRFRRSDPHRSDPLKQKRNLFRSKEKTEEKANPDNWDFNLFEVGSSLNAYLSQPDWSSPGVAQALVDHGKPHSTQQLWEHMDDRDLEKKQEKNKPFYLTTQRCPWLGLAVEKRSVPLVDIICKAGVTQQCLDLALAQALDLKEYALSRVLLGYGACFPDSRQLFDTAVSQQPPNFEFIELWLSAPKRPNRSHAWNGMKMAAKAHSHETHMSKVLAAFIVNVTPSPQEFYELLLAATKRYNLQNITILSNGVREVWQHAFAADKGYSATTYATKDTNDERRYRILNFLLSAGAEPDTLELRKQLLLDVRKARLDHVNLLVKHGVPPYLLETDSLGEAIKTIRLDVFTILMNSQIPPTVLPSALDLIPETAREEQRLFIVQSLSHKDHLEMPWLDSCYGLFRTSK